MSLEHSPARSTDATVQSGALDYPEADLSFWNSLINEKAAATFLGVSDRFLQGRRQKGGGPKYISISARCVRYRRLDLRMWSEGLVKTSTSDSGTAAT